MKRNNAFSYEIKRLPVPPPIKQEDVSTFPMLNILSQVPGWARDETVTDTMIEQGKRVNH